MVDSKIAEFFWNRYWWLRGIIGLISIASAINTVFDLSVYESIKVLYALLIGIDGIFENIAYFISTSLPITLNKMQVTIIALLLSVILPAAISLYVSAMKFVSKREIVQRAWKEGYSESSLRRNTAFAVLIPHTVAFLLLFKAWNIDGILYSGSEELVFDGFFPTLLISTIYLVIASAANNYFRRGIISLLVTIFGIVVIYHAPIVGDPIREWSDNVLENY